MKYFKFVLIIALFCLIPATQLIGQASHILTDLYHRDYDLINRTVIVLSNKPDYTLEQRVANRQIVVTMEATAPRDNLPLYRRLVSPVLESFSLAAGDDGALILTINTRERYHLDYFELTGAEYRLVLDIYNREVPVTDQEKFAFAKFYYTVGNTARAEELLREILLSSPRLSGANYYLGMILINRGEEEEGARRLGSVNYNDSEYLQAQMELARLGRIELEPSHEMEQLFLELRDNFLQAGDINRQIFMLALASAAEGDSRKTEAILSRLDPDEPAVEQAAKNARQVYEELTSDNSAPLVSNLSGPSRIGRIDPIDIIIFVAILIVVTAVIVYLITMLSWKSRLNNALLSLEASGAKRPARTAKERLAEKIASREESTRVVTPGTGSKKPVAKVEKPTEPPAKENNVKKPKPAAKKPPATKAKSSVTEQKDTVETIEKKPVKRVRSVTKKSPASTKPVKRTSAVSRKKPVKQETKPVIKKSEEEKAADVLTGPVDDLQRQLVIKLHQDGWDHEAIANELQIDIIHVTLIIDTYEEELSKLKRND